MADTLADRLKRARKLTTLTARALSGKAGLSPSVVSLIEVGRSTGMGAQTALKLARALGVSVEWLVDGVGDGPSPDLHKRAG